MKELYLLISILTISCISKKANRNLINSINSTNSNVSITKRKDVNFSDTLNNNLYDFNISNKIFTLNIDNQNRPFAIFSNFYPNKSSIGPQYYFHENSTKLDMLYFLDSSFTPQGPWFFYKKNGKLKHLLILKNGYCDKVLYTCSNKQLQRDTLILIKIIRGPVKNK